MCGCRKFRSPRGDSRKGKVGLAKTCLAGRAALRGGFRAWPGGALSPPGTGPVAPGAGREKKHGKK